MLFFYEYLPHSIEKLQEYIDHLFLEVWCNAQGAYELELLHPDLQEIITEIYYDASVPYGNYLYEPIEEVYDVFLSLDEPIRQQLACAYRDNNSIEQLCAGTGTCEPFRYTDLAALHPQLAKVLQDFFKALFTDAIHLKAVTRRIGCIKDHYKAFMQRNKEGKCPFCGVNDIRGPYAKSREAYDHFLPKSLYPFNSINFKNLAPMCHECNTTHKGAKDPLQQKGQDTRRRAFYPYSAGSVETRPVIAMAHRHFDQLRPQDLALEWENVGDAEALNTWLDVFDIEHRYKEKCLAKHYGQAWVRDVIEKRLAQETLLGIQIPQEKWLNMQITAAQTDPFRDANFIKASYLKACQQAGVFE